jgi:hypothetical protein
MGLTPTAPTDGGRAGGGGDQQLRAQQPAQRVGAGVDEVHQGGLVRALLPQQGVLTPPSSPGTRLTSQQQEFPATQEQNWFQKKIDVLRPYKFYLAFDNTDSWDYVSEKFFHGLVAGSVPGTLIAWSGELAMCSDEAAVYMGAPNIDDFSPSPHSVISTNHFKCAPSLSVSVSVRGR